MPLVASSLMTINILREKKKPSTLYLATHKYQPLPPLPPHLLTALSFVLLLQ